MEKSFLQKLINTIQLENYEFYGVCKNAERKMIVIYPEKMKQLFETNSFKITKTIKIK